MSWTLITSGGKGKESPFYREFLITSASDLQNEPDMSIATGSIACIVGSGLAMAHKYMKGQSGQWTEIPADVIDVQINGTSITQSGIANITEASDEEFGVVKLNSSYGISVYDHYLATNPATNNIIDARTDSNRPITPYYLPYAVKSAMTSTTDAAWSSAEQASARQRLGIDRDWVLKGTIAGTAGDRGNIDTGVNVDMTGCTELLIKGAGIATATCSIRAQFSNGSLVYGCFTTSRKAFVGLWENSNLGILNIMCKGSPSDAGIVIADNISGYCIFNENKISDITKITFCDTEYTNVTSCTINIYAR